jgi:hypothetical protein
VAASGNSTVGNISDISCGGGMEPSSDNLRAALGKQYSSRSLRAGLPANVATIPSGMNAAVFATFKM